MQLCVTLPLGLSQVGSSYPRYRKGVVIGADVTVVVVAPCVVIVVVIVCPDVVKVMVVAPRVVKVMVVVAGWSARSVRNISVAARKVVVPIRSIGAIRKLCCQ